MDISTLSPAYRLSHLFTYALFLLATSSSTLASEIEEIVVQASLLHRNADTGATPLHLIDDNQLAREPTLSLGETLEGLLGVSTADYGSGVGQPVIRGMSGNRVRVLQNGHVTRDISGLGGDHINEVMLENAQQIEVVRGPASLFFANGTIGGIINVVDHAIAQQNLSQPDLRLTAERQTVNDGEALSLSTGRHVLGVNLHYSGNYTNLNAYQVPPGAIHQDTDDGGTDEQHELRFLENSDTSRNNHRLGVSRVGDWGYVGASFTQQETVYGIPVHSNSHDATEGDSNEGNEEGVIEHDGERIFSGTRSRVWSFEGRLDRAFGPLNGVEYSFQDSEYRLTEQHAEGFLDDGALEGESPTLFSNDSKELSLKLNLDSDRASHRVVVNFAEEAVAILGEEAFMMPTESNELTLGYYFSDDWARGFHLDLGARLDKLNRLGQMTHTEDHGTGEEADEANQEAGETESFDVNFSTLSVAGALSRDFSGDFSISLGVASVERAPSVVEMFINGPHLAAQRYEVGDAGLRSERGFNTEINFSYQGARLFMEWTLFNNEVSDYIYLRDEQAEFHDTTHDAHDHGGLILAAYEQDDASFTGYEFELGTEFNLPSGQLALTYGRDQTKAQLNSGANVPRIAPVRDTFSVAGRLGDYSTRLSYQRVHAQTDVAENEMATQGYHMLNFSVTRAFDLGSSTLHVSAFGRNLLDDVARRHTSFVKEDAPLPGRNLGLKLSYKK